jgi:hypothetical protein
VRIQNCCSLGVKITLICIQSILTCGCVEGPAAHWLQSVNHRTRVATWTELCSWIHDRFGRDQHEALIRQLFHIKKIGSIQNYIDKYTELIDQLLAYEPAANQRYYTTRFADGQG